MQKQIFSAFVSGCNHAQIQSIYQAHRRQPSIIFETNRPENEASVDTVVKTVCPRTKVYLCSPGPLSIILF